jgi:hypothetical protein
MSKYSAVEPQSPIIPGEVHAQTWERSLGAALVVLRQIDARYAQDRVRLEASTGDPQGKRRWLEQLEARCRQEREPYVLHVADVHQRMTFASLFRTVH